MSGGIGDMLRDLVRLEVSRALELGEVPHAATVAPPETDAGASPRMQQILDAMHRGARTCLEIAEASGIGAAVVRSYLPQMRRRGLIQRVSRGVYEVAA